MGNVIRPRFRPPTRPNGSFVFPTRAGAEAHARACGLPTSWVREVTLEAGLFARLPSWELVDECGQPMTRREYERRLRKARRRE